LAGRLEHAAGVRDSGDNLKGSQVQNRWLHGTELSKNHTHMQNHLFS
jgi:hypothetical protein